jgi:UDP-2,3-diacylglucosamine pyrophosphatase LpxH
MRKRPVDIVVISDVHLGTYGCHAQELLFYLKSVEPNTLILNGDIIDIWNLKKSYFPKKHMQIIRYILKLAEKGTKVYYICGNHDELLRKYKGSKLGNISIQNELELTLGKDRILVMHGDVFDLSTKGWMKIIAKMGGFGYEILIRCNKLINNVLTHYGKEKVSISKNIKSGVKNVVKWMHDFEYKAAELAIRNDFDVVICGHIHQPQKRSILTDYGTIVYLNSGDWVENCTSLEYNNEQWSIFHFYNEVSILNKSNVYPLYETNIAL